MCAGIATAAVSVPAIVPALTGGSAAYRYDVDEHGPRGDSSTHETIVITRLAGDRAVITVVPENGPPSALDAGVAPGGALVAATRMPRPAPTGEIPLDRPLGGLPDDPASSPSPRPSPTASVPLALRAVSAILATVRTTPGASWAAASETGAEALSLTARVSRGTGANATLVADGTAAIPGSTRGTGEGQGQAQGQGQRHGGGYGRGGGGGGIFGLPFPVGHQGGMGSGSRGGNGNSGGQRGNAPQAAPTQATVHVETTLKDGRFAAASGTETGTSQGATTVTRTWQLTRLSPDTVTKPAR